MSTVVQVILSSFVPALFALAGIMYTQGRANKRANEDRRLEQFRWTRESRKDSYLALVAECQRLNRWMAMYGRVGYAGKEGEYGEPGPDWMKEAYDRLAEVEMFASETVGIAARQLVETASKLNQATIGEMMRFDDKLEAFRREAQVDLGLSVTTLDKKTWLDDDGPQFG